MTVIFKYLESKGMEGLSTIFDECSTDKGTWHHNYCRQYEHLFAPYRNDALNYIEIGVFKGASLRAMRRVFPNAQKIVGVDIDSSCKEHEDVSNGIYVEIGDATLMDVVENITQKHGTFDIILDDGSHRMADMINSFELLFPLLNDGGIYIIEDTNTYAMNRFQTPGVLNILQYFWPLTTHLNQFRPEDDCSDPFKIEKISEDPIELGIDKIEFGCSYIAVHKKIRHHWMKT
jgi:23S rRNA U2552 (ribose-2'-O)-methylase RlmE/FtsJ